MRALRALTVWLLMLAASGTIPVMVICACADPVAACGETCARCQCKRIQIGEEHLRGRCPCCQPLQEASPVTLLPPAVLPPTRGSLCPPPIARIPACAGAGTAALKPPVPDPPPRVRLLV